MAAKKKNRAWVPESDRMAVGVLIAVGILVRLPFFRNLDLVSFDGTFYINQARVLWGALLSGTPMPGQFPIGYPFFISLLLPLFPDDVIAAQVVSFLFGVGTLIVLFRLAGRFLPRHLAFYATIILALTPLFIRLSLETFSESTYVFWMLLTLLFYAQKRDLPSGLAAGVAAITRPEMLAIAGLLILRRARVPRAALMMLAGFAIVYAFNVAVFYRSTGEILVLPKTGNFMMRSQVWTEREKSLDDDNGNKTGGEIEISAGAIAKTYVSSVPEDMWVLARHATLVLLALAVFGAIRRPTFLLFAMVPFLTLPVFGPAPLPRFYLPYLPIVFLYAMCGIDRLKEPQLRTGAMWVAVLAVVAGIASNRDRLTEPVDEGFTDLKEAGLALRAHVRPGDKMADRKPYVAFYSGAEYVEIPKDNYDATMEFLAHENVRFISLYYPVIYAVRPILLRLLTDPAVILGELRYKQVYSHPRGLIVYERARDADALHWKRITEDDMGPLAVPAWSPDGSRVAFVRKDDQNAAIYSVPADGSAPPAVLVDTPGNDDHPSWSPDGTRLAFASALDGNWDVYVLELASGSITRVTHAAGGDGAPDWFPDGRSLVFVSSRSGANELWRLDLDSGVTRQLTRDGGYSFPAVSPSGKQIAAVKKMRGVFIVDVDSGTPVKAAAPLEVAYAPTWSPDGRVIAVTARDWSSFDIYLLSADGKTNLLLTKNNVADSARPLHDGYPAWSPDGSRLALVSNRDGSFGIYILEGLEPYRDRLINPVGMATVEETE